MTAKQVSTSASPSQTLARRLILTVFSWYLVLALAMTALQLGVQYVSARSDIQADLATLGQTVRPGMTDAVWELDTPRLASIARGVRVNAIVSGVTVRNDSGVVLVSDVGDVAPSGANASGLIREKVQLTHFSPGGEPKVIGELDLYAGPQVLWGRIKYGFIAKLIDATVVAAGLWLIFFLTIHYRLSRSVTQMASAVRRWQFKGADDPIAAIDYPYRDELGQLVQALGESQARLLESLKKLSDVNQNLEHLVAERTEDLLVAKEAAESADTLKSAFLATMSHELRTPLNSIIGFTGILLQGLAGPLNAEQAKQLGMVRTSARHLLALINDVLDISKIEAGQLEIAHQPLDVQACIDKVMAILAPTADKKSLALRYEAGEGLGAVTMLGDARRLEQVLLNLIGNSIKFTEAGHVTLTADIVSYLAEAAADPQPAVRLRVIDTGIGIRPENMDALFKAFRQVDSTLARQHEGTGLGLAICHRLVAMMGGSITAHSVWQQGSTFTVTLPLDARASKAGS